MKQIDEQHMLRYLRKISENTERIAKALEARNNPRQIVERALKKGPLTDEEREEAAKKDRHDEEVAKTILEGWK